MGGNGAFWGQPRRTFMSSLGKPFYTGSFRHTLDGANRLTIPSAWRSVHAEGDTLMVVPLDGFLSVLPPLEVQKLYDRVSEKFLYDSEAQDAASDFFSKTLTFSFDKSGRVMLTPELCEHAGIEKDVVLVGAMNKFNLFSPDQWARVQAANAAQKPSDRLRRMGI
jgi:MraZ protein